MQYLYLIRCQQFYKIGVANDVQSRLAQLSTGNPFPLTVEVEAVYSFENAETVERCIHQRFIKQRERGEWFRLGESAEKDFREICRVLGGEICDSHQRLSDEMIEEAEEEIQYLPRLEDVQRIMQDPNYRLEYRYSDNGLRGFAWRLRTGNKACGLYVGKSNPSFDEIKALLPEHQLDNGK